MKKLVPVLGAAVLLAMALAFGQVQTKLAVEPDPSFAEDAVSNHRHPGLDTDVFLYINHWRNSVPYEGHGGFIERDILTPGDPLAPPRRGAVLKYIKAYKRAALEPRTNSRPFKSADEQVFLYFCGGSGRVESGGRSAVIGDGTAVFIPAGVEARFLNPTDGFLEAIMVVEETTAGFAPNKTISVGDYHDSVPNIGMHWAHIGRGFGWDTAPKFAKPHGLRHRLHRQVRHRPAARPRPRLRGGLVPGQRHEPAPVRQPPLPPGARRGLPNPAEPESPPQLDQRHRRAHALAVHGQSP